ncbi:MAG: hypothetical protein MR419_08765 [Clostridiales bacterium]|nr:hypothetical protein [Clostridiales bacterium]MDY4172248.1 hypothetical protein [Evtepia sp.]
MKKRLMSIALALCLALSLVIPASAAFTFESTEKSVPICINEATFDINDDGVHTTAAVLVSDGVAYPLTEDEYNSLITAVAKDADFESDISPVTESSITPRGIYYKFVKSSASKQYDYSHTRRVSALYQNAIALDVTSIVSYTREVVKSSSSGFSLTANMKDLVDASITASYDVTTSASSSTSAQITGTFAPSGKYTYSAIVFTPRILTVTGSIQQRQLFGGEDSLISSIPIKAKYPVSGGGVFDGIYALKESNSSSDFPALGGLGSII